MVHARNIIGRTGTRCDMSHPKGSGGCGYLALPWHLRTLYTYIITHVPRENRARSYKDRNRSDNYTRRVGLLLSCGFVERQHAPREKNSRERSRGGEPAAMHTFPLGAREIKRKQTCTNTAATTA